MNVEQLYELWITGVIVCAIVNTLVVAAFFVPTANPKQFAPGELDYQLKIGRRFLFFGYPAAALWPAFVVAALIWLCYNTIKQIYIFVTCDLPEDLQYLKKRLKRRNETND